MIKKHNAKDRESQSMTLHKRLEFFKQIEEEQSRASEYPVHPEAQFLTDYTWEGILTIRFESDSYSQDNDVAEYRRDDLVGMLMNDLRRKWRLRGNQIYWVASTEFGKSGVAHCHIIFNFYPLKKKKKVTPDLSDLANEVEESLHQICGLVGCERSSVNVNWLPSFDDYGLVGYIAKIEKGRPYKRFFWSTDPVNWLKEEVQPIQKNLTKKINP